MTDSKTPANQDIDSLIANTEFYATDEQKAGAILNGYDLLKSFPSELEHLGDKDFHILKEYKKKIPVEWQKYYRICFWADVKNDKENDFVLCLRFDRVEHTWESVTMELNESFDYYSPAAVRKSTAKP